MVTRLKFQNGQFYEFWKLFAFMIAPEFSSIVFMTVIEFTLPSVYVYATFLIHKDTKNVQISLHIFALYYNV